jgi:hypothetical protein
MASEKLRNGGFTPKERRFWKGAVNSHVDFVNRYVWGER